MIVSINQPAYLPWLGYFHRIAVSDVHIVLDHVQFEKNSFVNRNKVRTAAGWTWLTVPVQTGGRFGDLGIDRLTLASGGASGGAGAGAWRRKHWDTLRFNYAKAAHFPDHAAFFERIYAQEWDKLAPLMRAITDYLLAAFAIRTRVVYSSELNPAGAKGELVLDLCRAVGATTYLSGPLGRDYLDPAAFAKAGIDLAFQDYAHPRYSQCHPGFETAMAAVDLLFNCGADSRRILLADNRLKAHA